MTKQEAFKEINETQDYYVNELLNKINNTAEEYMKKMNMALLDDPTVYTGIMEELTW